MFHLELSLGSSSQEKIYFYLCPSALCEEFCVEIEKGEFSTTNTNLYANIKEDEHEDEKGNSKITISSWK